MAKSQNGWPAAYQVGNQVYDTPPLTKLSWVTGSVRSGDVWTVLDYVARRFNNEVEKINPAHSWGFAPRPIRGSSTTLSNHASGTAVDFNAPAHPLGKSNTFSVAQRAAIRRILTDTDGVVRWGGDYTGRKDEMHLEINASAAAVKKVADKIRNTTNIKPPAPVKPVDPLEEIMSYYRDRKDFEAHMKRLAGEAVVEKLQDATFTDINGKVQRFNQIWQFRTQKSEATQSQILGKTNADQDPAELAKQIVAAFPPNLAAEVAKLLTVNVKGQ